MIVIERDTLEQGLLALSTLLVGKTFEHAKTVALDERIYLTDKPGDFETLAAGLVSEAMANS